ncbi:MAG: amidophosphoribosyltransferase [Clostridiaceae bacterium]|nr:amidophosphoribosyltransferase [Clostridiaceae bacterium]
MIQKELHDECGVFGILDTEGRRDDAARLTYLGLFALQHRGQDSAGIAINTNGTLFCHKDNGLVVEAFNDMTINMLRGSAAIGHVRYPTQGGLGIECAQPMLIKYRGGQLALAHNGSLTNAFEMRARLEENGAIFQTGSDSEAMLALLARNRILTERMEDAIFMMMAEIQGAYSLVLMTRNKIIGVRDPLGIRPLCLGRLGSSYILASETCAIESIGGEIIRDIDPGEVVTITAAGVSSEFLTRDPDARKKSALCLFEFVYIARPDSTIDGASVYEARYEAGRTLAREQPCDADMVIGAPDSGIVASMGYAFESGIPYGSGLLKNRYVGRTFIQPTQMQRELAVTMKFSALKKSIGGKRLIMVDDSIVRGTTTRHIISMLKEAGAKEVHMRIASPPVLYSCFYGVDTPSQDELSACNMTLDEIREMIGADSLGYISLEGLTSSVKGLSCGLCCTCFDGAYPGGMPSSMVGKIRRIEFNSGRSVADSTR